MHAFVELFKAALLPGSTGFLMLGLGVGFILVLLGTKARRWAIGWLTTMLALYLAMSLPIVAGALETALADGYHPIAQVDQAKDAHWIVVLSGGSDTYRADGRAIDSLGEAGSLRALEAARVYRMLGTAQVIASGGPGGESGEADPESVMLKSAMSANGVPASQIIEESASTDTHEQALAIAAILKQQGNPAFILVTSPSHMRRASAAMRTQGLDPIPSPSRQHSQTSQPSGPAWLPSAGALSDSTQAIREILAWVYYWERGWVAAGPS